MTESRAVPEAAAATADGLFAYRDDWCAITPAFDQLGRLPAQAQPLQARYGVFADGAAVAGFVQALQVAGDVAARLGGPAALRQRQQHPPPPGATDGAPDDLYAQLVAVAAAAADTARDLVRVFAPPRDPAAPAERAAHMRWALAGAGAPGIAASALATRIEALRGTLAGLTAEFDSAMQALHASQLVNRANAAIGELGSRLARHEHDATKARARPSHWLHPARTRRDRVVREEEIAADRLGLAGKQALVNDTAGLFSAGHAAATALAGIDDRLRRLAKVFVDAAQRLILVAELASKAQLADERWLASALETAAAVPWWLDVARAAEHFVREAPAPLLPAQVAGAGPSP